MERIKDKDVDTTVAVTNDQSPYHGEEDEETVLTMTRQYMAILGFFCALVTGTAIYIGVKTTAQQERIEHLTTETQILMEKRMTLNEDIKYLIGEIEKRCELCPLGWNLYKGKCYLFYDQPTPWKTWEQSRKHCQTYSSDLVVIDDLEEQEFVNKHIKYYYDEFHGYWMGLQEISNTWTWVNGRVDTLGFWAKNWISNVGPHALVLINRQPNDSWSKHKNFFRNKFICERDTLKD